MSPPKILLQTTIPPTEDDWSIARFGLLEHYLAGLRDADEQPLFHVTARDRGTPGQPDPVLCTLDTSGFAALWLFAVDVGDGLTEEDCGAISRFRKRGSGLVATRDHMDLGSSICTLGGVGVAHHFHTKNINPDARRRKIDDPFTTDILWPNFHSGANGDFQEIKPMGPLHPVLVNPDAANGQVRFLPSHPHEGDISAPPNDPSARVIATSRSLVTGELFNIAVAFEASEAGGRAIAQSTFHHFADYNWDPSRGKPSFVVEPPGEALSHSPEARQSIRQYVKNVALWLVGASPKAEPEAS